MVIIRGFNSKGEEVWKSILRLESYNSNRQQHENDAKQHGAVRVLVDMAI